MNRRPHGFVNTAPALWAMACGASLVLVAAAVLRAAGAL